MAKRRKKGRSKKKGTVGKLRKAGFLAALGIPGATVAMERAQAGENPFTAAIKAAGIYAARNPSTGAFDTNTAVYAYRPVAAFAVVDFVASKAGVYKHLGRILR